MLTSKGQREDFQNEVEFEESREIRKEQANKQAEANIDRQIEMFNEVNALFGYTRN
jgi:hypothetical protein